MMQPRDEEAPEPAAGSEVAEAVAAEPAPVNEAAEAEAPQQGAEAPAPADVRGKSPSTASSPSAEKERQIPVDPASLRRLGMVADEDSPLSAPAVLTEVVVQSPLLPPLRRPTFVGASLPCSAASSPVHGAGPGFGAKWEEPPATASPTAALCSLARQHSAAFARLVAAPAVAPPALSRSASRAEGRTMAPHDDDDEHVDPKTLAAEDGFTCSALCMLIPGFSKKKPAAAATAAGMAVSMQRQASGLRPRRSNASRVASLERFECGSWSPPPPPPAQHDSDCHALEVAKISCADDAEAPVKMAFVFDGDPPTRGIPTNSASSRLESARPSSSSPSSVGAITPRLARARAEFNAFLEAQSA